MDKIKISVVAVALSILAFSVRPLLSEEHKHEHGAAGPHGGEVQELGDKDDTHVELVHDHANGKVTMYLLGKDQKTPVFIQQAPKINLKAKDGNRQVGMTAAQFEASDEGFKADPLDGRIAITLPDGKQYNVRLDEHHDDHERHDHGK